MLYREGLAYLIALDQSIMTPRPPDFIGIGAQKAGTSWLRNNLARHPGIWMPPLAELHYFDRALEGMTPPSTRASERLEDPKRRALLLAQIQKSVQEEKVADVAWWTMYEFLDHGDDWYRKLFSLAPAEAVVGEITPRYAICGDAEVAHMHSVAPAAKLLFILRHPVDRFWSQCRMLYAYGLLQTGDSAAMRLFDEAYGRPRGEYTATLMRFCKYYDPSQILVTFYDAISREPEAVLQRIFSWLGLAPLPLMPEIVRQRVNESTDFSPISETLREQLTFAYRSEMEALAEVFGGDAARWLDEESPVATQPVIQLSDSHLEQIRSKF